MKIHTTSILISILFLLNQTAAFSQQTENLLKISESGTYAKLYMHTDREFYFPGDTIWFKGYYLNGQTQHFIPGICNMYVDLIDKKGQIILKKVYPFIDGNTAGNVYIPDSLKQGNYLLRAFTDYQKEFGEDAFFHKSLKISKLKSSSEPTGNKPAVNEMSIPEIDIAFLPEGGFLLENQANIVGVKSLDKSGKSISIQGEILDSKGQIAAQFTTKYKGMDLFFFTPLTGERYTTKIAGYPDYQYEFSNITKEGIKFRFILESIDVVQFLVTTNSNLFQGDNYYFAVMHRGKVLFYKKFVQKEKDTKVVVNKSVLQAGINKIVLLDEQLKPISERLFFLRDYEINDIQISLNQNKFSTRTNVQLELFDENGFNYSTNSSLSLTVVDDNAVGENGPALNILSWLLIDSELKGTIESPSDFFEDDSNITSARKLNLLMLTQGWSNYLWNTLPKKDSAPDFNQDGGISIKGKVEKIMGKKSVSNGNIVLNISKNDYFYSAKSKIGENGRFSFDSIFFTDTAWVFTQARNKKGKLSTEILLDPIFEKSPGVSKLYLPATKTFTDFPVKLYQQQYFNEKDLKDYLLKSGSILLEEVIVKGEKTEKDDSHFRIYSKPHNSLKITEQDLAFRNVADYLQGRVAGVQVVGNKIMMIGQVSFSGPVSPLFLLDGNPVPEEVIQNIPMNDIDVVEVLKANDAAIFGVNGGAGVISIFTKQGDGTKYIVPYSPGIISKKIIGYSSYRQFYSPKYTPENIGSEQPDHRLCLYWNPNIITENGRAFLSFFTSDDISHYKIFVEGISDNGEICLGVSEFSVNMLHTNSDK
ncbi:MAG: TonB-dependent receptor plug domain-containing protein [Bacteroidales bacterium]|nr:TonB-dependent receptor plug domain-containing protein [Bacteroidales bacterium]